MLELYLFLGVNPQNIVPEGQTYQQIMSSIYIFLKN